MTTTGNSSPFALCIVIMRTRACCAPASSSTSDRRDNWSTKPPSVGSGWRLSYSRAAWTASANANAVGPRFERDFETFSDRYNGGYVKFDVAGSYRLRSALQLTARIENVLDRQYAEVLAFPAPGRTVHAGVQYGF